ncbi:polysaccharide biosynthesis tyrosine autokinase [Thalassiella azotivora]
MSLRDYVAVLRRRWVVVVATLLVCLLGALGVTLTSEPVYRAQATTFVTMGSSDESGTLLQGSQFALQRVKSYTDVVHSPDVLEPVIRELGLDASVGELRGRVQAINPADTVLIDISATSDDPAEAAALANAVTVRFAAVIERLETPREGGASPVKVTVTIPAGEPSAPVSPRPSLNLVLALALGVGLGSGLALLREQLDTSVRTAEEITRLTSAGPLGMVDVDPQASKRPLVVLEPDNSRAEAYRTIRTNLQFVDVDNPPRRFVVTSAVQGEGKSTTTCNLAVTLAQGGRRVCVVDADLRRPRVADLLGVEGAVGLSNVLAGQHDVEDVLVPWHGGLLTVLPAGTCPPNPSELLGSQHMSDLLGELSDQFDVLVVDSPPLLPVSDAVILAEATDGAVLVVRHGSTSREQVATAVGSLRTVGAGLIGTVMTFVPRRRGRAYRTYRYEPTHPSTGAAGKGPSRGRRGGGDAPAAEPRTGLRPAAPTILPALDGPARERAAHGGPGQEGPGQEGPVQESPRRDLPADPTGARDGSPDGVPHSTEPAPGGGLHELLADVAQRSEPLPPGGARPRRARPSRVERRVSSFLGSPRRRREDEQAVADRHGASEAEADEDARPEHGTSAAEPEGGGPGGDATAGGAAGDSAPGDSASGVSASGVSASGVSASGDSASAGNASGDSAADGAAGDGAADDRAAGGGRGVTPPPTAGRPSGTVRSAADSPSAQGAPVRRPEDAAPGGPSDRRAPEAAPPDDDLRDAPSRDDAAPRDDAPPAATPPVDGLVPAPELVWSEFAVRSRED